MNAFFLASISLIARLIIMVNGNQPEASVSMKAKAEVSEFIHQLAHSVRERSLRSSRSVMGDQVLGGVEQRHLQKDLHADAAQRHQQELKNHQAAMNRRHQAEASKRRLAAMNTRKVGPAPAAPVNVKKQHELAHADLKKSHLVLKMNQMNVLKRDNYCNMAGHHNNQYCSNTDHHG